MPLLRIPCGFRVLGLSELALSSPTHDDYATSGRSNTGVLVAAISSTWPQLHVRGGKLQMSAVNFGHPNNQMCTSEASSSVMFALVNGAYGWPIGSGGRHDCMCLYHVNFVIIFPPQTRGSYMAARRHEHTPLPCVRQVAHTERPYARRWGTAIHSPPDFSVHVFSLLFFFFSLRLERRYSRVTCTYEGPD